MTDISDGVGFTSPPSHIPKGWRLVLIVGGLSIFGPLCIDMYTPALPAIGRNLGASASSVQLTITSCLLGIAIGQLLFGPISDRLGRRPPMLFGLAAFIASSAACMLVSNIYVMDVMRVIEGIGGSAGIVIARAIVRDLFQGVTAAKFYSTLMLVIGLGPILAPQIGAGILRVTSWRGIFFSLVAIGTILFVVAFFKAPETLPPDRRRGGGFRQTLRSMSDVSKDRTFLAFAVVSSLSMATIFAYIAGSPFVLQNVYGLSPQMYGLAFALNGAGLVVGAQINGHWVHRFGSAPLLTLGLSSMTLGALGFLGAVGLHLVGLTLVLTSLFLVLFGVGFISPNSMALALQNHPNSAGTASALLGSGQNLFGAAIAPIVGIAGDHDPVPMGIVMVGLAGTAMTIRLGIALHRDKLVPVGQPQS